MKKKSAAIKYLKSTTDLTPEKKKTLQDQFSMSPNTQDRLFRSLQKSGASANNSRAKKRLFREEGGGRKLDNWWQEVEPHLLRRFKTYRDAGSVVLRSHIVGWVIEICHQIGIDLAKLRKERQWKNFRGNLKLRVRRFCKRKDIKMKRASRQLYKNPKAREKKREKELELL